MKITDYSFFDIFFQNDKGCHRNEIQCVYIQKKGRETAVDEENFRGNKLQMVQVQKEGKIKKTVIYDKKVQQGTG